MFCEQTKQPKSVSFFPSDLFQISTKGHETAMPISLQVGGRKIIQIYIHNIYNVYKYIRPPRRTWSGDLQVVASAPNRRPM